MAVAKRCWRKDILLRLCSKYIHICSYTETNAFTVKNKKWHVQLAQMLHEIHDNVKHQNISMTNN